jgi:hypothetical protein
MRTMTRESSRRVAALALCLTTGGVACVDLAHTNPFDPATKVDIQVSGPDSASSLQQILTYSFTSNPEWPGVAAWRTSNEALLHSLGDGRYGVVGAATPPNDTSSVVVVLGTHVATHRVVVQQRLTGLTVTCVPANSQCVLPIGTPNAAVSVTGHDANGFGMAVPFSVQIVSRQSSIVRMDGSPGTAISFTLPVTPLARGTSYIVASSGQVRDSVLVTVP